LVEGRKGGEEKKEGGVAKKGKFIQNQGIHMLAFCERNNPNIIMRGSRKTGKRFMGERREGKRKGRPPVEGLVIGAGDVLEELLVLLLRHGGGGGRPPHGGPWVKPTPTVRSPPWMRELGGVGIGFEMADSLPSSACCWAEP